MNLAKEGSNKWNHCKKHQNFITTKMHYKDLQTSIKIRTNKTIATIKYIINRYVASAIIVSILPKCFQLNYA